MVQPFRNFPKYKINLFDQVGNIENPETENLFIIPYICSQASSKSATISTMFESPLNPSRSRP